MKILEKILIVCAAGLLWNAAARADDSTLTAPVKSVYDDYLKIQASLSNDSMSGVAENADAIAKVVQSNANALPAEVSSEAGDVAKATNLPSARAAFNPLSNSLIKYLADHKDKTAYVQVYCPMANASWLQGDKNVKNPYLGKEMSECGEIQN